MTTAPIKNSSRFWLTTALRALMWCLIIFCLNIFIESSAPAALLYAATISGCTAGSLLARSSLKTLGLFLVIAVGSITIKLLSWIFFSLPLPVDFSIYGLLCSEQISIALVITTITLLTSWTFWRSSLGLALEALLLVATLITTLSAHRNYRFDLIKLINDLAWDYHISPLAMIIIIAAVFIALICLYLYSQNLTGRPQLGRELPIFSQRLKTQLIPLILICSTLIGLSTFTAYQVFQYHQKISATQLSSGVGQEEKEGLSPLTFHQSLGKSNEPMALMRLDSEYLNNPDSPMLYLRETALSKIRGHEMVIAPEEFDRDVPRISPGQTFLRKEEIESEAVERSEIIQSIYLITKHKLLFGIDIPTRYSLLNLPQNSKRFKAAFRAYSMVPHYDRQILQELNVGDPTWTPETIRHYTEGHKDPRYREMALRITAGLENKSHQALRVIEYLSKNAIYTLTPNHKGGSKDDQTAEFLFGDMRGYCVHFAHASVFLLRALGIPARVASGYMNDLSKSRDGHLLLRASDRHAWAEVYFEGIGWGPLDTEPEHVESHADSPIDIRSINVGNWPRQRTSARPCRRFFSERRSEQSLHY